MTDAAPAVAPAPFLSRFADWAATPALSMPGAVLAEARLSLLDTLACLYAGRAEAQTRKTLAAMRAGGASGPVRTLAGDGLSASAAALVNGVAAHALDYDDYEVPGSTHPSAPILGALLALAEIEEPRLAALLEAYVVGYEANCRFGEALGYGHYMGGWHSTSTIGALGASAAAARLRGLSPAAFTSAMSLATSMAAGLKAQFGSDAKALHAGLAARAGVDCALLAGAGLEAEAGVIEARFGFLARYGAASSPGFQTVATKLGGRLAIDEYPVLRKPWPCCAYTHRALEGAGQLAADAGFDAAAVVAGVIRVPEPYARVAGIADPHTAAEARFSLRYCVASMLLDGDLRAQAFSPDALARPATRALMSRLVVDAYDPGPGVGDMSPAAPDSVSLRLADGSERIRTIAEVRGGMTRPLTQADIVAKFLACGGPAPLLDAVLDGDADTPFRLSRWLPSPPGKTPRHRARC